MRMVASSYRFVCSIMHNLCLGDRQSCNKAVGFMFAVIALHRSPLNGDVIDGRKEPLPPTLVHLIFGIGCPSMKQASLTVCCTRRT